MELKRLPKKPATACNLDRPIITPNRQQNEQSPPREIKISFLTTTGRTLEAKALEKGPFVLILREICIKIVVVQLFGSNEDNRDVKERHSLPRSTSQCYPFFEMFKNEGGFFRKKSDSLPNISSNSHASSSLKHRAVKFFGRAWNTLAYSRWFGELPSPKDPDSLFWLLGRSYKVSQKGELFIV